MVIKIKITFVYSYLKLLKTKSKIVMLFRVGLYLLAKSSLKSIVFRFHLLFRKIDLTLFLNWNLSHSIITTRTK